MKNLILLIALTVLASCSKGSPGLSVASSCLNDTTKCEKVETNEVAKGAVEPVFEMPVIVVVQPVQDVADEVTEPLPEVIEEIVEEVVDEEIVDEPLNPEVIVVVPTLPTVPEEPVVTLPNVPVAPEIPEVVVPAPPAQEVVIDDKVDPKDDTINKEKVCMTKVILKKKITLCVLTAKPTKYENLFERLERLKKIIAELLAKFHKEKQRQ